MKTINFANLPKREKSSKFAMEKLTCGRTEQKRYKGKRNMTGGNYINPVKPYYNQYSFPE